MVQTLDKIVEVLEEQEALHKPIMCPDCWVNPVTEGGVCADCLYGDE